MALQQPASNMTDRSVDSGVGSDVAMTDLMEDDHQVAPLKDVRSPDKGHHKVKVKGHDKKHKESRVIEKPSVLDLQKSPVKDASTSPYRESPTSKEAPYNNSKPTKRSKTKAALKQPPSELIAAEITATLKSPSDVPDELSMPLTLPGFEDSFTESQPTVAPSVKPEKSKSKSKKKSKKEKERKEKEKLAEKLAEESKENTLDISGKNTMRVQSVSFIPETITFSENDLSDVLDQVESLGDGMSTGAPKLDSNVPIVTSPVIESPVKSSKKSKHRKKKSSADHSDGPASKKAKTSGSDSVKTSKSTESGFPQDLLETAMKDIGPIEMDYTGSTKSSGSIEMDYTRSTKSSLPIEMNYSESSKTTGSSKVNLDRSESPMNVNYPQLPGSKAKSREPSIEKEKDKSGKLTLDVTTDSEMSDNRESSMSIPNFGFSPIPPPPKAVEVEKDLDKNVVEEKTKSKDKSKKNKEKGAEKSFISLDEDINTEQNNSNKKDSGSVPTDKELHIGTTSFYSEIDSEDLIGGGDSLSANRKDKHSSPSPVSKSVLDIIPMTPRTVDHLAKSLGCDPVTPFDGDTLANISNMADNFNDNDSYPWLNTPNLPMPATPGGARHSTIASLARFDSRGIATPKHPVSKSDSQNNSKNQNGNSSTTNPPSVPPLSSQNTKNGNNSEQKVASNVEKETPKMDNTPKVLPNESQSNNDTQTSLANQQSAEANTPSLLASQSQPLSVPSNKSPEKQVNSMLQSQSGTNQNESNLFSSPNQFSPVPNMNIPASQSNVTTSINNNNMSQSDRSSVNNTTNLTSQSGASTAPSLGNVPNPMDKPAPPVLPSKPPELPAAPQNTSSTSTVSQSPNKSTTNNTSRSFSWLNAIFC